MNRLLIRSALLCTGILSFGIASQATQAGTVVRFTCNGSVSTENGSINYFDVELFDNDAPNTVANFLQYVNNHYYDNTIVHRSVYDFVIQSGGYTPIVEDGYVTALAPLSTFGAIQNEFSFDHSNVRGTIAMAKLPGDPDSATCQWFVNLSDDNSANLDYKNDGYTVFGQVIGDGMTIVDVIGGLQTYDVSGYFGSTFTEVPLFNNGTNFVTIISAAVVPEPGTLTLLLIAGLFVGALVWRRRP